MILTKINLLSFLVDEGIKRLTLPSTSRQDPPASHSESPELKVLKTSEFRTYGINKRNRSDSSESLEIIKLVTQSQTSPPHTIQKNPISESETSSSKLLKELVNVDTSVKTTPRKKKLKTKIAHLKKHCKRKQSLNYRLQKKCLASSTQNVLRKLLENKSPSIKTLVSMQCFHKTRTAWTKSERRLALSLYYKSPGSYKYMLQTLKFILPGISTIQSWLKVYNLKTGVNTKLIEKLKLKVSRMEEFEKHCVVMFDEISLKKGLDYNRVQDLIEGFEDFANIGRTANLGNQGLLFYLRGLLYNWKMPFCYYVSSGPAKSDTLASLILEVIRKLNNIGLIPLLYVTKVRTTEQQ